MTGKAAQRAGQRRGRISGLGVILAVVLALLPALAAPAQPEAAPPAAPADGAASAEPTAGAEARPEPVPASRALEEAWHGRRQLDQRVDALRQAGFAHGIRSLDAAARSLLLDREAGDPFARARAAASLAPDLPDARFALARAHWSERRAPADAASEVRAALGALGRHLEASLWFDAAWLHALSRAAAWAGALFLLVAALVSAPGAARQTAAAFPGGIPLVSGFAWVAAVVSLPVALGEGWAGVVLGASAIAFAYGTLSLRIAAAAAAGLLLLGLHPLADRAGRALATLAADPVAEAAWRAERDLATPLEIARLERAGDGHPLAARALALHARREGRLEEADRRFGALLAGSDPSPGLLHNLANVRLGQGRDAEAISLYERALALRPEAATYWNLSQAYGRSIRIDEQDDALRAAQAIDATFVKELTAAAGATGYAAVLDLPLDPDTVRAALGAATPASADGRALRRPWAPGRLGASLVEAAAGFGGVAALAVLLGLWLRSRPSASADEDVYLGIARALQGGEAADPAARRARLSALRDRRARHDRVARWVSVVVPGAAGILGRHAFLGLAASGSFAAALAGWLSREGPVPDPLAGGETGAFALGAAMVLAAVAYAAVTGLSLVLRERS